ncbi:hypothetical protein ACE1SV_72330 [Streptomyces sp. E-15]
MPVRPGPAIGRLTVDVGFPAGPGENSTERSGGGVPSTAMRELGTALPPCHRSDAPLRPACPAAESARPASAAAPPGSGSGPGRAAPEDAVTCQRTPEFAAAPFVGSPSP